MFWHKPFSVIIKSTYTRFWLYTIIDNYLQLFYPITSIGYLYWLGFRLQIKIPSASRSLGLARVALLPSSALTSSGEDLSIAEFNFLAPIIPQPDRPATQTGDIMTDQTSVTVRFITESNAMETVMDMVEPIPDSMNQTPWTRQLILFSADCWRKPGCALWGCTRPWPWSRPSQELYG